MTVRTKTVLKGYFNAGDIPTESNFADLVDTIGTATLTVAANDASDASKGRADYVCDGTADDVQIQEALDALSGGCVTLTEGTFSISSTIDMVDSAILQGQGTGSILKLAASANTDVINVPDATYDMMIRDIYIHGNRDNNTSGIAITFPSRADFADTRTIIDHVTIRFMDERGIEVNGAKVQNLVIRNCFITDCDEYSLFSEGVDLQVTNCSFGGNATGDLVIVSGAYSCLVNCLFYNSAGVGLVMYDGDGLTAIGCSIDRNATRGLYASSTTVGLKIIGCHFHTNSKDGDNSYSHIDLAENNVTNIVIVGNIFNPNESGYSNNAKYAVEFSGGTGIRARGYASNSFASGAGDSGYTDKIGQWSDGFADGAAANISDGGTIAHGMGSAPTVAFAQTSVASEMASITGIDATNITVAIKQDDGSAGTQQTIYWRAWV